MAGRPGQRGTAGPKRAGPSYHHGDLARALVDAAITIIGKDGIEGLTLKGAAAHAGVTHAAVYRHFEDKHALLVGVAERGFERFTAAFAAALASAPSPPSKRSFLHVGRAVLRFAVEEPVLYRVMFSGIKRWTMRELARAPADSAFGQMLGFVRELQRAEVIRKGDATQQSVAIWSTTHGLATLAVSGALPISSLANESELARITRIADSVHETLLDGLSSNKASLQTSRGRK